MDNFQLYRTNLSLGGQMKWDLIINSAATELYVADFHLTPISNNIPFTFKSEENLLKNKHQDNVKSYFKKIEGYFYNAGLDSSFSHNWPLICKENEILDAYSNIYDMGCKRSHHFKLYKKQFEFLCPVWIEKLTGDLEFKIEIRALNSTNVLSSNVLRLAKNDIASHSKFVDYFNEYIDAAGLHTGSDDLMNIKFTNSSCVISGLSAADGVFVTKSIDSFTNNIVLRERPLMEVDNMIVNAFKDNSIIANQLFNFNLCFNIEDIISGAITDLLAGQQLQVSVDVYVDGKMLDKKDFYTEYEFIQKDIISDVKYININVLDYLCDYNCIDLIDKNKFCQDICHWSLCDNNDYIFNVYDGFSGIIVDNESYDAITYYENEHQYGCTSNTMINKYDISQNTAGWINTKKITRWSDFYKYIKDTEKNKKNCIHINGNQYINNIRYNNVPIIGENGFYSIGMIVESDILASIIDSFPDACRLNIDEIVSNSDIDDKDKTLLNKTHELCWLLKDNTLLIISSNADLLAFNNMHTILYVADKYDYAGINDECKPYVKAIYTLINSKSDAEMIVFGGSILWGSADGPSNEIKETVFYKDNSTQNYVIRYDGKIKPTFVDTVKNTLYYKDYVSDDRTHGISKLQYSDYVKYINTGYEPLYPSIKYCAIKKLTDWNYKELPKISVTEHNNKISIYKDPEYSWFNNSVIVILNPELKFKCINKQKPDGSYESLMNIIKNYISNTYEIDDSTTSYIISKYDFKYDWEYLSDENINDYVYTISMILK